MTFRVSERAPGNAVDIGDGLVAYMPNSLPPELTWTPDLARANSGAEQALGRLDGAGIFLEWADRLARVLVLREAVASSRIEGTLATTTDLALFEAGAIELGPRDTREVSGYLRAFDFVMNADLDRPFTLSLVREIHSILMRESEQDAEHAGRFRDRQNYITSELGGLRNATHVPPPPLQMKDALQSWESYACKADDPNLIRHALLHYQFECIHPFIDGNGRVGRLLIAYFMRSDGMLTKPLFALSMFFERNRSEYYHRLNEVTRSADWMNWILFYLRGVKEQADEAIDRFRNLNALRARYQQVLSDDGISARGLLLLDELFAKTAVTAASAAKVMSSSQTTAQRVIDRLSSVGILREVTNRKRGRIYLAHEILEEAS